MKDHHARALDRINMDVLFRYRIMIKYVTIIAGVMIFFGMVYLNNREITKTYDSFQQSKSTYRHQQLHPHFHPRDLEVLLMRRRHQSLPLYEAGVPGVSTGGLRPFSEISFPHLYILHVGSQWLVHDKSNLNVRFKRHSGASKGMNFGFSWDHVIMKQLFKPNQKFIDLEKDYVVRPTIVMPLSTRRYEEGLDAIGSIHKYLPTEKLVIYDIGLTLRQRAHITAMCNVELIDVPFKLFPPYSRMLMRFHWKPLVMQLALSSYGAILWIESSTRFITGELSAAIEDAKKTGIKIFGLRHSYSTFSVTNPQVFKYLPSDYRRMRISGQFQTAPMIIYNTRSVCDRFMKWLVLCALERRCMSPMRATRRCYGIKKIRRPASGRYLHCHRFDQSVINVLLKNMFNFDMKKIIGSVKFSTLKRGQDKFAAKPRICRQINLSGLIKNYKKAHPHANVKIRYRPLKLVPRAAQKYQKQINDLPILPIPQAGVPQQQAVPLPQQGVPQQQAVPLPQQGVPQQQAVPLPQQGVPQQGVPQQQAVPLPQQGVPHQQAVPIPQQAVPILQQGVPQQQAVPIPQQGVPQQQAVPLPQKGVPQQAVPIPQQGVPQQQAVPIPQQGVPQQQAVPIPQQGVPHQQAVPIPQQAVPIPQQAVPIPQQAVPIPQQGVPQQQAVPIPQQAVPIPQQAVPIPQQVPQQQGVPLRTSIRHEP